jgi:hypothetical protein
VFSVRVPASLLAAGTRSDFVQGRIGEFDTEIREEVGCCIRSCEPLTQKLLAASKMSKDLLMVGKRDHVLRDFAMSGKSDLAQNEVRSREGDDFLSRGGDDFVRLRRAREAPEEPYCGMNGFVNHGIDERRDAVVLVQIEPNEWRLARKNDSQPKSIMATRHVLGQNGVGADDNSDVGELSQYTLKSGVFDFSEPAQGPVHVDVASDVLITSLDIPLARFRSIEFPEGHPHFARPDLALCSVCRGGAGEDLETLGQTGTPHFVDIQANPLERLRGRGRRCHSHAIESIKANEVEIVVD